MAGKRPRTQMIECGRPAPRSKDGVCHKKSIDGSCTTHPDTSMAKEPNDPMYLGGPGTSHRRVVNPTIEQRWLNEYVDRGCRHGEGVKIAMELGVAPANATQWVYNRKKKFANEIAEALRGDHIIPDETLKLLADHALGIQDYVLPIPAREEEFTKKDGTKYKKYFPAEVGIDIERLIKEGKGHLIQGLGRSMSGQQTVTFTNSLQAVKELLIIHGFSKQRVEHSGPNGGPIDISTMSPDQRLERLNALIDRAQKRKAEAINVTGSGVAGLLESGGAS